MSIGQRLRDARTALGYTQADLAKAVGIARESQGMFERDVHVPGGKYLVDAAALGVDVGYVLTGAITTRDTVESELLTRFRAASPDVQGAVVRALGIPATGQKSAAVAISGGEQGQVVVGNLKQRGVTFNVGGKKGGARK